MKKGEFLPWSTIIFFFFGKVGSINGLLVPLLLWNTRSGVLDPSLIGVQRPDLAPGWSKSPISRGAFRLIFFVLLLDDLDLIGVLLTTSSPRSGNSGDGDLAGVLDLDFFGF